MARLYKASLASLIDVKRHSCPIMRMHDSLLGNFDLQSLATRQASLGTRRLSDGR